MGFFSIFSGRRSRSAPAAVGRMVPARAGRTLDADGAWREEVYTLLQTRFSLEREDMAAIVEKGEANPQERSLSPHDYVETLAKRFSFFEL